MWVTNDVKAGLAAFMATGPGSASFEQWGAVVDVDDRNGGTVRLPGPPWRFSEAEYRTPARPAWQGEHNEAILREAGVSESTINELRAKRILVERYTDRWKP